MINIKMKTINLYTKKIYVECEKTNNYAVEKQVNNTK